jgi:hypothetical protein
LEGVGAAGVHVFGGATMGRLRDGECSCLSGLAISREWDSACLCGGRAAIGRAWDRADVHVSAGRALPGALRLRCDLAFGDFGEVPKGGDDMLRDPQMLVS